MRRATGGLLTMVVMGAMLLTLQLAASAAPSHDRSRAFEAWAQSLTSRAEHERTRAQLEIARADRARTAWAERLTRQAERELARPESGMSERAKLTWSERLTALAEHHGATD
jgi:hypothetical protein